MTFTAPHIDYAGLSPVIALSAGIVAVLIGRRPQRPPSAARRLGALADHPRHRRRPLHLAVGRRARTWSPGALRLDELGLAAALIAIFAAAVCIPM